MNSIKKILVKKSFWTLAAVLLGAVGLQQYSPVVNTVGQLVADVIAD